MGRTVVGALVALLLAGCSSLAADPERRAGEAVVYFVLLEPEERAGRIGTTRSALLTPRTVEVETTGDPAVDALRALMSRDAPGPGLTNTPVSGFRDRDGRSRFEVVSVEHADGLVTVDFTADFHDPCPVCGMVLFSEPRSIVQQYVHTVQAALGTDDPVLFTARGEPVDGIWWQRLRGPVAADLSLVVPPERPGGPVDPVDLATAPVPRGAPSMAALVSGVVRRDDRGCLGLDSGSGAEAVVWPDGFTAWDAAGGVVLLDDRGLVVAREGDRITAGGGLTRPSASTRCVPDGAGEATHVQTDVRVRRSPRG